MLRFMADANINGTRSVSTETRAPRADAARNRDQLLAVATRVFMSADAEPSMRAIAREAGVGIATLAASLIGIFTVAPRPAHEAQANRLLNLLMDGLHPRPT
jgi:hypothetical protein